MSKIKQPTNAILLNTPGVNILGHDCLVLQTSKAPAPATWCVFFFDQVSNQFVSLCPEPADSEERAKEIAAEVLSDPLRYTRCLIAHVSRLRDDGYAKVLAKLAYLEERVNAVPEWLWPAIEAHKPEIERLLEGLSN